MDSDTLVDKSWNDGQILVEQLVRRGYHVAAAFWLKPTVIGRWRFYVASEHLEAEGAKAYGRLHAIARAMPMPFSIDPLKIRLVEPSDPVVRDALRIIDLHADGTSLAPIRWTGSWLGNRSIEGAYLYPVPTAVPV